MLLCKGANASAASEDGWTPLHLAARQGRESSASLLMKVRKCGCAFEKGPPLELPCAAEFLVVSVLGQRALGRWADP